MSKKQKENNLKTWHHMREYPCVNVNNTSALFDLPSKIYQRHFVIHPEWIHTH